MMWLNVKILRLFVLVRCEVTTVMKASHRHLYSTCGKTGTLGAWSMQGVLQHWSKSQQLEWVPQATSKSWKLYVWLGPVDVTLAQTQSSSG